MGQADCEEEMNDLNEEERKILIAILQSSEEHTWHIGTEFYLGLLEENQKLKAQLEVATDSLMKIARSDPPGYLKEVEVGYLMNEAREALKKIEEMK
jgi:hypothetical protein